MARTNRKRKRLIFDGAVTFSNFFRRGCYYLTSEKSQLNNNDIEAGIEGMTLSYKVLCVVQCGLSSEPPGFHDEEEGIDS